MLKPIPRPCKICKKATTNANSYCDLHQGSYKPPQAAHDAQRGSPSQRGYDATWRKFRAWFLGEYPECSICSKPGMPVLATEVHHIVPLVDGGARLDPNNCMGLCKSCHSKITSQTKNNS